MYRTSAKLVRHLALRFQNPLDRQHILGHDNVPGTVASTVRGMHWDPGPYWDWSHYFELTKAPLDSTGVQIQFGHRVMYANLDDVLILPATVGAPK
ncbi:hypothetical protein ABT214_15320 [Micromonospora purpureochromogenes]|uniref:hypothetical protein n=1 Tax=Micromonospora purpureochromogenes TaxID=47872 RepID=UPI00331A2B9F